MIDLHSLLKSTRSELGLSQSKLAAMAGVSLATLQKIESGQANPELKTVVSLLSVLGLKLEVQPVQADFDRWQSYGLPVMTATNGGSFSPNREKFLKEYPMLNFDFLKNENGRNRKAWASYLRALSDHYPSVFGQNSMAERWLEANQDIVSPKLRRIALETLGKFL